MSAWRVEHRKDGGARFRRPIQQDTIPSVGYFKRRGRKTSQDTSEDETDGPTASKKRVTPPTNSSPVPLRRSSRNVPRVNYRELDSSGFD